MHIGISVFPTGYCVDIAVLARHAEEMGFESLWVPEHPIIPVDMETSSSTRSLIEDQRNPGGGFPRVYGEICDPFVTLARASAVTTKLRLGTGICLVPERNPLLLAKQAATLDMYSEGVGLRSPF